MNASPKLLTKRLLVPFILVTTLFFAWGFANDITNPMVKAFSKIFRMSATDGTLVQAAFYGGYFVMALPAALFIRRYSYKKGILLGLALYAAGALLFIPSAWLGKYYPFLISYFILTCGLSFLETSSNPYIMSMGAPETATRRLNLAQAFNPIGSLMGMFCAMNLIQARLSPLSTAERAVLSDAEFEAVKQADLDVLIAPYVVVGLVIAVLFLLIFFAKMPESREAGQGKTGTAATFKRLLGIARYREGVVAQFFYVGAQIMCWTFIIQYGTRILTAAGMGEQAAEVASQRYNIAAMVIFCISRFICTFLLKYISPGRLLMTLAVAGGVLVCGVIGLRNIWGLYCLVGVSACMSLMFPTIYGVALEGLGEEAKLGAAGLIMAILGGSVLPMVQASIIDCGEVMGWPAVNASFVVPLFCFAVIALYGYRTCKVFHVGR